ncbi:MAG: type I polyketide synthase, partial [Rubrivivax sp.]
SFGAGGSNAHLIIEEYVAPARQVIEVSAHKPAVVVLSARDEDRLKEQAELLVRAIKERNFKQEDLADIAYTLQVGREAMGVRLACVVVTIDELKDKLQRYSLGEAVIDDLYRGEVKRNKEALEAFTADEDLAKAMQAWVAKGKFHKLLDLWVKGLNFDWALLHGEVKPRRISLPTYPFARERYWLPMVAESVRANGAGHQSSRLHPLLHRNTSDLSEQRFSSTFTGQEFFLRDHVIQGQRVLPGVVQLALAREAVSRALGAQVGGAQVLLQGVVFVRPAVVDGEGLEVHIALEPDEAGVVSFEIYSAAGENELVHSQGRAVLVHGSDGSLVARHDLQDLGTQCAVRERDAAACYGAFAAMGLAYGPAMQALVSLRTGQDAQGQVQALGQLELPAVVQGHAREFELHPSLMDGALQATAGLMLDEGGGHQATLPFALEQLEVFSAVPAQAWVWVRYSAGSRAQDAVRKLDL